MPTAASVKPNRRLKEPLPDFSSTLFGPFGCLDQSVVRAIHADERWYGDRAPHWNNAPTASEASAKADTATKRLRHRNYAHLEGTTALAAIIAVCVAEERCASHACPLCARAGQRWLVDAFGRVLRKPQAGFEDFGFNFVMPDGQVAISDLRNAPFDQILDRCRTALENCIAVEFAVLGIDTSANDDNAKFKRGKLSSGPRLYFQVHVYGIVRTSNRDAVWDALRHLFPRAANIYRPLSISDNPFNGSSLGISYICKPDGYRHSAYWDNKRGEWNTPRKPAALKAREHVHYLLAMHELGFARRIAFVGLHPVITGSATLKKRGVVLRKVFRRRPTM